MIDKLEIQELKHQLISLTGGFCKANINEEYTDLCEKLIGKMARKRNVPFTSGRIEIWAAAVVHAIGTINFLFDKKTQPYASIDEICEYFGVSKSTTTQKSKLIRDLFKMAHWDPDFSTHKMLKDNPYARLARISGYLVMLDQ
jgi:hypothetical protein